MTKTEQIIERVVVSFFEGIIGYVVVVPSINWTRATLVGATTAGLSAAYNVLRQSEPTIVDAVTSPAPSVPETPLNGVEQIASQPPEQPAIITPSTNQGTV
jgi:hypothetical protein